MPVYLLHGFKWPRPLIRIHIILQNLDDAAAEWLVSPGTTACMLDNFNTLFPDQMKNLPNLRFVEQFDPTDESTANNAPSQPFAYVADVCHEVKLGIDIDDVRGKGVRGDQWSALMELRDKIAPEERPGWFVVVCGDEERLAPSTENVLQQHGQSNGAATRTGSETESSLYSHTPSSDRRVTPKDEEPRGFRKLFGGFSRRKSNASMSAGTRPPTRQPSPPPIPSPPKPADKLQQLPVSRSPTTRQFPSVITNNDLVLEVDTNTRTLIALSMAAVTPSRLEDDGSRSRSISPIEEEPASTPGTEYSTFPNHARHGSNTLHSGPRGVSSIEVPVAKHQMNNLYGANPGTSLSISSPLRQKSPGDTLEDTLKAQRSAQSACVLSVQTGLHPDDMRSDSLVQSRSSSAIGHQNPLFTSHTVDDGNGQYEVITMAPRPLRTLQTRDGARSSGRRTSTSSVMKRTSPDTYQPKGWRSSINPSQQSKAKQLVSGQNLNQFDLVANNIEIALNGLR